MQITKNGNLLAQIKPEKDKVVLAQELPNLKALAGPFLWECFHSQLHSAKFLITAFPCKLVLVSPTADRFSVLVGKNSHLVGRRGQFWTHLSSAIARMA